MSLSDNGARNIVLRWCTYILYAKCHAPRWKKNGPYNLTCQGKHNNWTCREILRS